MTFILDTYKSAYATVPATLAFLAAARARRKIFVLGHMADYRGSGSPKYRKVAREALAGCDEALFVSPSNNSLCRLAEREGLHQIKTFETLYELNAYLQPKLQPGDLVVLKGSAGPDHLERLSLARDRTVHCWRQRCGRDTFCPRCELWSSPFTPVALSEVD